MHVNLIDVAQNLNDKREQYIFINLFWIIIIVWSQLEGSIGVSSREGGEISDINIMANENEISVICGMNTSIIIITHAKLQN